jgi:hypothetical protein
MFDGMKRKRVEKENFDLKTKLLNKQWDLIANIQKHFDESLEKVKTENNKKLELYKKETEKVVSNFSNDLSKLWDKIDKLVKAK